MEPEAQFERSKLSATSILFAKSDAELAFVVCSALSLKLELKVFCLWIEENVPSDQQGVEHNQRATNVFQHDGPLDPKYPADAKENHAPQSSGYDEVNITVPSCGQLPRMFIR